MLTHKGQIERTGKVCFGDASISVVEEGIGEARKVGGYAGELAWRLSFKRQVFARVIQTLNRMGWTVAVPPKEEKQNSASFSRNYRNCSKGDLRGELGIMGRSITFAMWQGVNTPTRPDHGGRYESDLEGCMPYVIRLEMERTRRRIRGYLCNVFTDYDFDPKRRSIYRKPLDATAAERIERHYAESWHFKGDLANYTISDYNRKSHDGVMLEHGQRVWFADWHGRICNGTAMYNINNMWWIVTGRYDYTNKACFEIYAKCPENPRVRRNASRRTKKLQSLLTSAITAMKFERAAVLRDILHPELKAATP